MLMDKCDKFKNRQLLIDRRTSNTWEVREESVSMVDSDKQKQINERNGS